MRLTNNPIISKNYWLSNLKQFEGLSSKSKKKAVYEYLFNNGFLKVAETFKKESNLEGDSKNYPIKSF